MRKQGLPATRHTSKLVQTVAVFSVLCSIQEVFLGDGRAFAQERRGPGITQIEGREHLFETGSNRVNFRDGFLEFSLGSSRQVVMFDSRTGRSSDLGGILLSAPVAIRFNQQILVFGIGRDNALWFCSTDGQPWQSLGGGITRINQVYTENFQLVIEAVGTNGLSYNRTLNNGWTEMRSTISRPQGLPSYSEVARSEVNVGNGLLRFFLGGQRQLLVQDSRTGLTTDLGGILLSNPQAIRFQDDVLIFGIGVDKAVYYRSLYSGWQSMGGDVVNLERVTRIDSQVVVQALFSGNRPHWRNLNDNWVFGNPHDSTSNSSYRVDELASTTMRHQGNTYSFYIGPQGQLLMRDRRFGNVSDLGGRIDSDPLAMSVGGELYIVAQADRRVFFRTLRQDWADLGGNIRHIERVYRSAGEVVIEAIGLDGVPYIRTTRLGWTRQM